MPATIVVCCGKTYIFFSCSLQAVEYARQMLSPVKWAEVCFTSAKTGQRCTKVRLNFCSSLAFQSMWFVRQKALLQ